MDPWRLLVSLLVAFSIVQAKSPLADFEVTVRTDVAVGKVSDKFVSITLDAGIIVHHWQAFNPDDPHIVTLAAALSPAYVRLGGTTADSLIFVGQQYAQGLNPNSTFTANDWDRLNLFARRSNLSLIFGLNSLYRPRLSWDPANAIELMKYSAQQGYVLDLELGNEPDIYDGQYAKTVLPGQLTRDFGNLRNLMDTFPSFKSRQLFGPDTTSDVTHTATSYIQSFMQTGGSDVINAMTFHHYYMSGATARPQDFVDVKKLDSLKTSLVSAKQIISNYSNGTKTYWLGETSTAWGGGAPGLSNTFVAGFMWLDKLGLAALHGADAVLRQEFVGLSYGLVDYTNGVYTPNPDYWLTVLFKNLVGETVLQTQGSDEKLRIYAHCANTRAGYGFGSVTFYMMNLYNTTQTLTLGPFAVDKELHLYTLSSGNPHSLVSRSVLLNGKPLELTSGQLPPFTPIVQNSTTVNIAPFTMMFVVVPGGDATACTS